jgi:hypothetical protein
LSKKRGRRGKRKTKNTKRLCELTAALNSSCNAGKFPERPESPCLSAATCIGSNVEDSDDDTVLPSDDPFECVCSKQLEKDHSKAASGFGRAQGIGEMGTFEFDLPLHLACPAANDGTRFSNDTVSDSSRFRQSQSISDTIQIHDSQDAMLTAPMSLEDGLAFLQTFEIGEQPDEYVFSDAIAVYDAECVHFDSQDLPAIIKMDCANDALNSREPVGQNSEGEYVRKKCILAITGYDTFQCHIL